jgi:hypothetical protein
MYGADADDDADGWIHRGWKRVLNSAEFAKSCYKYGLSNIPLIAPTHDN